MTTRFELGCPALPFIPLHYQILTREGHRLEALLRGEEVPRTGHEDSFIRCVRDGADYDSHQCVEADAWRQLIDRREFERDHPPPGPNRTWVRRDEIRPGMIVFPNGRPVLLRKTPRTHEARWRGTVYEYRNAPDLPWHPVGGGPALVTDLTTRTQREVVLPGQVEAADGLDRVMTFVWRNDPDEDAMLLDPDTGATYHVPPDRTAEGLGEVGGVRPDTPVRVQWWGSEPAWVWGPA